MNRNGIHYFQHQVELNQPTNPIRFSVLVLKDPRLPVLVKRLFWLAFVYLICPFDLQSDFLPGGLTDDSLIVPILVITAVLFIPKTLFEDARLGATRIRLGLICISISSLSLADPAGADQYIRIRPDTTAAWNNAHRYRSSIHGNRSTRQQPICKHENTPLPSIISLSPAEGLERVENLERRTGFGGTQIRRRKLCASGDDSEAANAHPFDSRISELPQRSTGALRSRPSFICSFLENGITPC